MFFKFLVSLGITESFSLQILTIDKNQIKI